MAVVINISDVYNLLEKRIKEELKILPKLTMASVAIGSDPTASIYRASQKRKAQSLGIDYLSIDLENGISFADFSKTIERLNKDDSINAIIITKPFSAGWKEEEVFESLDEAKDVEGMHPFNLGKLFMGKEDIDNLLTENEPSICISPTVRSIVRVLSLCGEVKLAGKKVTIVGFSSLIGKPLVFLFANALATVSIANIETTKAGFLADYIKDADILVSAAGVPGLIKASWIKPGAIIIDVGTGKKDGKISGDVEFALAKEKAAYISPVPGGVGRLTPLFLYGNLIHIAKQRIK